MSCSKCAEIPDFHKFIKLGKTNQDYRIYYIKFTVTSYQELNEEAINNLLSHLDQISTKPWIWIINTNELDNLKTPNIFVLRTFYTEIQKRYKSTLKKILVINKSIMLNIIYNMLYPFLSTEIVELFVFCSTDKPLIELGLDDKIIKKIFY